MDSLRLDSMKKMLPSVEDSTKVELLNLISREFDYFTPNGGFKYKKDSVHHYASMALNVARKIGYKPGIAMSLLSLKVKDDTTKEKNIREAIKLAEETNHHIVLGWAYYDLANLPSEKNFDFQRYVDYSKRSIYHFQKAGDLLREAEVTTWLCSSYSGRGEYEKGFEFCEKAEQLSKKLTTFNKEWAHWLVQFSLHNMSELYKAAGDYQTALDYLHRNNRYAEAHNLEWFMYPGIGEIYNLMGQYDSAFHYLFKWKNHPYYTYTAPGHKAWVNTQVGHTYLLTKQYNQALKLFQENINHYRRRNNNEALIRPLLLTGKLHLEMKNYPLSLKYAAEGVSLAEKRSDKQQMMEGYELLSKINHRLGRNDKAYQYLLKYVTLKDSVVNRQFLWRLNTYKRAAEDAKTESRIGFLNRENKIKEQQLKQESFLKWSLFTGMAALMLMGIFVFRNLNLKRNNEKLQRLQLENELAAQQNQLKLQQLESEKKHAELQQQAAALEMQALRAQMNPHFIFNCLSSINRFIIKNESKAASQYLTRFSRLIRMVLMNSQKSLIALEDELHMLRLYLDMERLRFKNSFDYNITFTNSIDADNVFIPPLLLQPFCENAIWHGLMHKEGQGQLDIILSMQGDSLHCTITDNGIGREKAAELNSKSSEKEKSLGLKITNERLALLNREKGVHTFYTIEDIRDAAGNIAGTQVNVKMRYKESVEDYV